MLHEKTVFADRSFVLDGQCNWRIETLLYKDGTCVLTALW